MNSRKLFLACLIFILLVGGLLLGLVGNKAHAEDSCSEWMRQTDGTYWMECVDDRGRQSCWWADANGENVTRIKCE